MKLSEAIIKRISDLAVEHKIAIPKWSMRAGITPTTMYGILKRTSGCPRLQTIKLLCDATVLRWANFQRRLYKQCRIRGRAIIFTGFLRKNLFAYPKGYIIMYREREKGQ